MDNKELHGVQKNVSDDNLPANSQISAVHVGRENLSDLVPPHESYEGKHRWDPGATWTEQEERKVVRKTDLLLMTWLCLMVCFPT